MWIVQWETADAGSNRTRRKLAEQPTEAAADAHARRLTHTGIRRVTYFEVDPPDTTPPPTPTTHDPHTDVRGADEEMR